MADPFDESEEKPLDPAVERVQRRLRRLMLISGLTLGLGMFAVFGAILYRIVAYDGGRSPEPVAAGSAVPSLRLADFGLSSGARLIDTALDGDRLSLTYDDGGSTSVIVVDLPTMAVVNRLRLTP